MRWDNKSTIPIQRKSDRDGMPENHEINMILERNMNSMNEEQPVQIKFEQDWLAIRKWGF